MHYRVLTILTFVSVGLAPSLAVNAADPNPAIQSVSAFVTTHCVDCHSGEDAEMGFDLDSFTDDAANSPRADWDTTAWEKILKRIESRQMPPPESGQPNEREYDAVIEVMQEHLEKQASEFPSPGHLAPIRRLTRVEFQNSVRDLLSVKMDIKSLLPADPSSDGFDNITVGELSPALLQRYLTAAQKISRLAVGMPLSSPDGITIRLPADQTQESHVVGLPFGTRGGTLIEHHFPNSGIYEIQVRLMRDRDEAVEGLNEKHELDILLDRRRVARLEISPPKRGKDHTKIDSHLNARFSVTAGPHKVGVTFPQKFSSLQEIKRKPFDANYNRHRHPRRTPAVSEVSIVGPFQSDSKLSDGDGSPNRRKIFGETPITYSSAKADAERILGKLLRLAYRRPITESDLDLPMEFFDSVWEEHDSEGGWRSSFDLGIEFAIASILVNPHFLFRVEHGADSDSQVARLTDLELATRLSFFLWSSIPDDELLTLAEEKKLREPDVLEQQVRRMLQDRKSSSLAENFADQWLYLRNLPTITPDLRRFADFDNNLREAFRAETQLLFSEIVRDDTSVLRLVDSKHTYLNDRLARHYDIPGVFGSHFRKMVLPKGSHRGGILRHGSILMATSYATRTSPTIRGNWVLENIIGTPPPPPPPNVPNLKESVRSAPSTLRQRLARHREDPACASCHDLIDPVGFALENFDAVGRWRWLDDGSVVDARGRLPDGTEIGSIEDLEAGILRRPELFVGTMVKKLMTYGLGRTIELEDGPAIRKIVDQARPKFTESGERNSGDSGTPPSNLDGYRFSDLVVGIVKSRPFLMRENTE